MGEGLISVVVILATGLVEWAFLLTSLAIVVCGRIGNKKLKRGKAQGCVQYKSHRIQRTRNDHVVNLALQI